MKKDSWIYCVLIIPVVWFALLIAPCLDKGIFETVCNFDQIIEQPFSIIWCENSIKTVMICVGIYAFGILYYVSEKKNYRNNEEYGSAKWGDVKMIDKKYANKNDLSM